MAALRPAAQHSPRPGTNRLGDSHITSARDLTEVFSHSIAQDAANTCTSSAPYASVKAGKQCDLVSVETVTNSRWQDNVSDQSELIVLNSMFDSVLTHPCGQPSESSCSPRCRTTIFLTIDQSISYQTLQVLITTILILRSRELES